MNVFITNIIVNVMFLQWEQISKQNVCKLLNSQWMPGYTTPVSVPSYTNVISFTFL